MTMDAKVQSFSHFAKKQNDEQKQKDELRLLKQKQNTDDNGDSKHSICKIPPALKTNPTQTDRFLIHSFPLVLKIIISMKGK